jgi:hypothetical protein
MRMIVVITAVALGLSGLSAAAENAGPARRGASGPDGKTRVPPHVRCDKNGDGVLSRDEWPFSAELFTKLDKNGDGVIDADERPGLRGKRGKGGEGRGKGAPGAGGQGRGKGGPGAGGRGK